MTLTPGEHERYNRQILLQEIGYEGQQKLHAARVLVIGAGGLGCPVLLYLAAAGVGTIGIVDFDKVELSNLQRQVLFTVEDIGKSKADRAAYHLSERNPFINVIPLNEQLTVENTLSIFENYDIIIDGSDNFPTRYLVNDACVILGKTLVYGSIFKFNGQAAVFNNPTHSGTRTATYRCVYPDPPAPGSVSNCVDVGVLGVLPGVIGSIQATETIKLITGTGESLAGRLLAFDAKEMKFNSWYIERNESLWKDYPSTPQTFVETDYHHFCNSAANVKSIDPVEFDHCIHAGSAQILDVREIHEMPVLSEINTIRIPFNQLRSRFQELNPNKRIIVVCAEGYRSKLAIKMLEDFYGFNNLMNLEGGIKKWLLLSKGLSYE